MEDRWSDHPEGSSESARLACELSTRLWDRNSLRRQRVRRQLERYHGSSLTDGGFYNAVFQLDKDLPLVWNLTRSYIGTIVSRVGASAGPKVQFVTSDASWTIRRRARKLDQFVDALALQPCLPFANVDELRVAVLRDACLFGVGIAQVSSDADQGRVVSERVLPWEVMFDTRDARYGAPVEWVRGYPVSKRKLKAWYPDKAEEIEAAKEARHVDLETELGSATGTSNVSLGQVFVYEVWLCASSPTEPGRHIIVIDGTQTSLVDEEYKLGYPPFAIIYWDHPLIGGWCQSLADEAASIEDEVNRNIVRLANSGRRSSLSTIFYQEGSVDASVIEETTDAASVSFSGPMPPTMVQAQMFNSSMIEWVRLQYDTGFNLLGISQMAATGEREPGLSSGAAVRAVSAQQSQRFAWLWKQVENWQLQWARLAVAAVRHIADVNPKYLVKWPGAGFLKTIPWKDVDLDEDEYSVQTYAVGNEKNTPADRLQRAEELYSAGVISLQSYQAISNGTQDIQAESRQQNVQRDLISTYIERWLDATDEQLSDPNGWYDVNNGIKLVPPPIKWLNLPDAIMQVALAYLEAELDGCPDANRRLFLDWLEMADSLVDQQQQRKAQLQDQQQQANKATAGISPEQQQQIQQQAAA
jgi:hypothetical protein